MGFNEIIDCFNHYRINVGLFILITLLHYSCFKKSNDIVFKDIAPIIHQKCAVCHFKGGAGPFELITYTDIKKHANKIRFSITSDFMPPWPADTSYTRFADELILTLSEKEKLLQWIEKNYPAGDTSDVELPITYSTTHFRKPDLIVPLSQPIYLQGNGNDHFFIVLFRFLNLFIYKAMGMIIFLL